MVHHGLWDYDLPAAPNLVDIRVNGAARQGRRAGEQAGFLLRLRPGDGQADLAHRRAARPAVNACPARRPSPTQPFPTKPAPFDRQGITENDVIDFTPELRKEALAVLGKVQLRPAVHAAFLAEADDRDARHRRRSELVGRGVRPRDRDLVRPVDHAPVRGHAGEVAGTACRLCRDVRPGGDDAGHPPLEAALRANHRHRSEHGRPPVDGPDGRPGPKQSRIETARPPAPRAGPRAVTCC